MERVFPEKTSGPEMAAEVSWPTPFPVRMPPRVVEAVPPYATPRVEVATTAPSAFVVRSADVRLVIANCEVVAFVDVEFVVRRLSMTLGVPMVEDAYRAVLSQSGVVVEKVVVAKVVAVRKG